MKMAVLWVVVEGVYRRFRGAYCLNHQGAMMTEAVNTSEMSLNFYQTARRMNQADIFDIYFSGRAPDRYPGPYNDDQLYLRSPEFFQFIHRTVGWQRRYACVMFQNFLPRVFVVAGSQR
jgi:hypothetical protein